MTELDDLFWNNRYKTNDTAWDIGCISPPLKAYFDQLGNKNIKILIPGCGNAYEVEYLLKNNFTDITIVDISEILIKRLQEKFSDYDSANLKIICSDFFDISNNFDLIIEQTFFCALSPSLRINYVEKVNNLLIPNGKLVGLFFNKDFEINPPFGGDKATYEKLFSEKFNIKIMDVCYNSIAKRQGAELFVILESK